ncbi:MAG: hypothetical protein KGI54_16005 [Pseudomonadota bacterium]|nr:hypothetical protein [Pseudomonadota bacterium]
MKRRTYTPRKIQQLTELYVKEGEDSQAFRMALRNFYQVQVLQMVKAAEPLISYNLNHRMLAFDALESLVIALVMGAIHQKLHASEKGSAPRVFPLQGMLTLKATHYDQEPFVG